MMFQRRNSNQSLAQAQRQKNREARDAESLWRFIHAPKNVRLAQATDEDRRKEDVQDREVRELSEVSQLLRVAQDDPAEKARLEMGAQEAFQATHKRLMQAIENDADARREKSSSGVQARFSWFAPPFTSRNFRWSWAPVAAVLMMTALSSHSIGYYHALRTLSGPSAASDTAKTNPVVAAPSSLRLLPVQSLVNAFDDSLRNATPLEFVADQSESPQTIGRKLKKQLGVAMHLPIKPRSGAKLLGVQRHFGWNRPGVQAHYVKNGVRVAVYQFREPNCGLGDLNEVEWNGHLFMTGSRGAYRVVAWRSGEDVMTMVSPLAMREHESLLLAEDMRQPNDFA